MPTIEEIRQASISEVLPGAQLSDIKGALDVAVAAVYPHAVVQHEELWVSGLFKVDLDEGHLLWVGADRNELARTRLAQGLLFAVLEKQNQFLPWDAVGSPNRANLSWPPAPNGIIALLKRHAQEREILAPINEALFEVFPPGAELVASPTVDGLFRAGLPHGQTFCVSVGWAEIARGDRGVLLYVLPTPQDPPAKDLGLPLSHTEIVKFLKLIEHKKG